MPEQSVRAWLFNRLANKKNKVMLVGAGGICYNQVWLFFLAVSLRREGMWDFSDCISALSKKVLIPPPFPGEILPTSARGNFFGRDSPIHDETAGKNGNTLWHLGELGLFCWLWRRLPWLSFFWAGQFFCRICMPV
jgi:hypothetical protein